MMRLYLHSGYGSDDRTEPDQPPPGGCVRSAVMLFGLACSVSAIVLSVAVNQDLIRTNDDLLRSNREALETIESQRAEIRQQRARNEFLTDVLKGQPVIIEGGK